MRLLLTRPAEEAARSRRLLEAAGHRVLVAPVFAIESVPATLDLAGVQALAVTSRQGAAALARATARRDLPVFAVGEATAERARAAGFTRVEAAGGDAAALADLLARRIDPAAGRVLHATGEIQARDLGALLRDSGVELVRTILYRARPVEELDRTVCAALRESRLDAVAFFSPRAAGIFARLAVRQGLAETCGRLVAACLSPAVAARAGKLRWRDLVVAERPDLPSLVAALAAYEAHTDGERA
jgi:uroporphyrinogen-III synthase